MTVRQYRAIIIARLSEIEEEVKEIKKLSVEFKKDNPDEKYESVLGIATEIDKKLEDLSFTAPYVEDVLNGKAVSHTRLHKESGYDDSRTKKVRMTYGYNI